MSFKKLNDLFIESDKFNQIVESPKTDVQKSVPSQLNTPTPSQIAQKFADKRVEQVQAGFGEGVDFLPNDKASGFDVNQGQTSFNNISQTPISDRGIGGVLGDGAYEPSVALQTRFDLDFQNLTNPSNSLLGIEAKSMASNSLLGEPIEFRSMLSQYAESNFSTDIINQSRGSIEGSIFDSPEFNFDFSSGVSKLVDLVNPPQKKLSKKDKIRNKIKEQLKDELDSKKNEYLDELKKGIGEKLENPQSGLYKGISGVQTKVFKSIDKNLDAFGNSKVANFIRKKGKGDALTSGLSSAKESLVKASSGTNLVALAKEKSTGLIDEAMKKMEGKQDNASTEDPVPIGAPEGKLRYFGWDTFYNADHTSKEPGYHYGPNVSSDNLDLKYQGQNDILESSILSRTSDITGGKLKNLLGDKFLTKEPYIVSSIPTTSGQQKSGVFKIIDQFMRAVERYSPLKNAISDVERIGKFMSSPAGIAFIGKQELLGGLSKTVQVKTDAQGNRTLVRGRQRYSAFYDPIRGTLASIGSRLVQGGDNVLYTRTPPAGADEETYYAGGFPTTMAHSAGGRGKGEPTIKPENVLEDSFTGAKPLAVLTNTKALEIAAQEAVRNRLGFGESGIIKEKSQGGDKQTLAPITAGSNLAAAFVNIETFTSAEDYEKERSGLPFYFKDLRDNSYLIFRGFITGFTEEISPTWNNTVYIGRSEPVYQYDSTERSLSFTLRLFAHTEDELTAIYVKMNRLTSMCYPQLLQDSQLQSGNFSKIRNKPPLLKLRIGELIGRRDNEVTGFIKSLSYSYPDESPWETKSGRRVPKFIECTIGYQVIHATVPNFNFANPNALEGESFYGITNKIETETTTGGDGLDTNVAL